MLKNLSKLDDKKAPMSRPGVTQSGGGGSPAGADASIAVGPYASAVGAKIRECYSTQLNANLDIDKQIVHLDVTVDESGTARDVQVSPQDAARAATGTGRAFAEQARRAVLDPVCAKWPLPAGFVKGRSQKFTITFRP